MGKWICNRCGKELFEKPYKNQTCDCKGRFARFTVCENCGKWFKNEKGYKFCSTECGRGKRDRGGKIEVICDCCGKTFTKYKSDLKSKKHFCSVECKREYEKQNRVERTCKECGRIFQIPKSVISGKTNASLRERQLITYMKIKGCQTVGDNQVKA